MPFVPALERHRRGRWISKFKDSLVYAKKPCLQKQANKQTNKMYPDFNCNLGIWSLSSPTGRGRSVALDKLPLSLLGACCQLETPI